MADKDLDRIKRIADTLPDLDRAFLNRVAATLVDQEKAIQLHEATHELNFSTLEHLISKLKAAGLLALFLIVTGIYTHDTLSGRNRICFYSSVAGDHAVTIDAMNTCPLTWEFEV
jgi:hypothetical protein